MPEVVTSPFILSLVTIAAYLLGSVPFGIVIAKIFGLGNLREIGSGNIGATNVLRTGNKPAASKKRKPGKHKVILPFGFTSLCNHDCETVT